MLDTTGTEIVFLGDRPVWVGLSGKQKEAHLLNYGKVVQVCDHDPQKLVWVIEVFLEATIGGN